MMLSIELVVDGDARLPSLDDEVHGLLDGGVALDGHHVDARHHDLPHRRIRQLEDIVDHLALFFFEHPFLLTDLHQQAKLFLGDERAAKHGLAAYEAHEAVGNEGQSGDERSEHAADALDGSGRGVWPRPREPEPRSSWG